MPMGVCDAGVVVLVLSRPGCWNPRIVCFSLCHCVGLVCALLFCLVGFCSEGKFVSSSSPRHPIFSSTLLSALDPSSVRVRLGAGTFSLLMGLPLASSVSSYSAVF